MSKVKVLNVINIIFGSISLVICLWLILEGVAVVKGLIRGSYSQENLFGLGILMLLAAMIAFFIFLVTFILRKIIKRNSLLQQSRKYSNFAVVSSIVVFGLLLAVWILTSFL